MSLTSSGSMSLNSMPRPVQAMKWELDGSSSKATRNCQSCSEPLRWYDGPSRYKPDSCLMSPTGNGAKRLFYDGHTWHTFHFKSHCRTHLPPFQAPRRYRRRSASPLCQTYNLENNSLISHEAKTHTCTTTTSTRIIVGTFSPVSVSQIAVLP